MPGPRRPHQALIGSPFVIDSLTTEPFLLEVKQNPSVVNCGSSELRQERNKESQSGLAAFEGILNSWNPESAFGLLSFHHYLFLL